MAAFIVRTYADGKNIICQCEYGQSHGNQFLITICNKESKSSKQSSIILDIGFLDSDSDL